LVLQIVSEEFGLFFCEVLPKALRASVSQLNIVTYFANCP
jgi:hypothetical protein